ncbi:hypothetical protein [Ruminiclostridium josui]|uniref:hypothetical protein n=1 Tax=Ruminiclostridium josui TaxID=1499 RepID=UPI00156B414E|nr:hypothetical protein [Ruminiclostridium josui]
MSDGKVSYDEPLETTANILEAIIDTILYGSTGVKIEKLLFCANPFISYLSKAFAISLSNFLISTYFCRFIFI